MTSMSSSKPAIASLLMQGGKGGGSELMLIIKVLDYRLICVCFVLFRVVLLGCAALLCLSVLAHVFVCASASKRCVVAYRLVLLLACKFV